MAVSENRGTPKSSILIGFSIVNHPFWGTTIFGNPHIGKYSNAMDPMGVLFVKGNSCCGVAEMVTSRKICGNHLENINCLKLEPFF